ncbi:MAG TPA: P-loop NTPase, partial [Luteolibacter sp.]|nr:P-loop NTPase [Luteolibacter sp.]
TTPQEVALIDARKAVSMFGKVNVPILGLVENMAWFECDHGTRYPIFGEGGGAREAELLGVPLLAQIPIDIPTRQAGDHGAPVATLAPTANRVSAAFHELAGKLVAVGA